MPSKRGKEADDAQSVEQSNKRFKRLDTQFVSVRIACIAELFAICFVHCFVNSYLRFFVQLSFILRDLIFDLYRLRAHKIN